MLRTTYALLYIISQLYSINATETYPLHKFVGKRMIRTGQTLYEYIMYT